MTRWIFHILLRGNIEVYGKWDWLPRDMKIMVASIARKRGSSTGLFAELLQDYVERSARYIPCTYRVFPSEERFLSDAAEVSSRTRPVVILADSQGKQLSSQEIADALRSFRDAGVQLLIFAIGPADGWSAAALARADRCISFGRITLPHELAAVVAAEQVYRALTILAGHPYHSGH